MSVNSYGVCQTNNKDVFLITGKIRMAIESLISEQRDRTVRFDKNNKIKEIEMATFCEMITIHFNLGGETRKLSVHFDCDSDMKEIPGQKIIWSLNSWGQHELIIKTIAKAMKDLGPVFILDEAIIDSNFQELT